jgi:hypothetical protein
MKVTINKEMLDILTVNEYEHAREMVKDMRDDETLARGYAEMAANAILSSGFYGKYDSLVRILSADATICRDNETEWNRFGDGCGYLNVWISAIAETYDGFLKFGCLLSDIWDLDGSAETKTALVEHGYIRYYTEKET